MKKNSILILLIIFFSFLLLIISQKIPPEEKNDSDSIQKEINTTTPYVQIGKHLLYVEIADTNTLRTQGLSNKDSLAENTGMFFMFDSPGDYGFWMKDMKIPLDIIFIDKNFTIRSIKKAIYPNTFPEIFTAGAPIQYVLEVSAGFASSHNIEVGDFVSFGH